MVYLRRVAEMFSISACIRKCIMFLKQKTKKQTNLNVHFILTFEGRKTFLKIVIISRKARHLFLRARTASLLDATYSGICFYIQFKSLIFYF